MESLIFQKIQKVGEWDEGERRNSSSDIAVAELQQTNSWQFQCLKKLKLGTLNNAFLKPKMR